MSWLNDYMEFNASGDKLAAYLISGQVVLFDLSTGKRLWWQKNQQTCSRASVQFDEANNMLFVLDYVVHEPTISHWLRLSDGKDLTREHWNDEQFDVCRQLLFQYGQHKSQLKKIPNLPLCLVVGNNAVVISPSPDQTAMLVPLEKTGFRVVKSNGDLSEYDTDAAVVATAFSKDGRTIAVLQDDGVVLLWRRDGATLRKVMELK